MFNKIFEATKSSINEADVPDDAKQMIADIDWKALGAEITKVLGTTITIEPSARPGRFDTHIGWSGKEELVSKSGVFAAALSSVSIESFNTSSVAEATKSGEYWCTMHLAFSLKEGGSNGVQIGAAWFNLKSKKWAFKYK